MTTIDLDEFLEFVEQKNIDSNDESYHSKFVKDTIDEYLKEDVCPQCGSRLKETKNIWSKTGFWILEYRTICKKCGHIIEIKDNRNKVKEEYLAGNIIIKDIFKIVKEELGLE